MFSNSDLYPSSSSTFASSPIAPTASWTRESIVIISALKSDTFSRTSAIFVDAVTAVFSILFILLIVINIMAINAARRITLITVV